MPGAQAAIKDNVEGVFKGWERQLCQSIPSRKCKSAKARRKSRAAAREKDIRPAEPPAESKPEPKRTEAAPKWKTLPPIPKRKPKIAGADSEPAATNETVIAMTPPPLPREKPEQEPKAPPEDQEDEDPPPLPKPKPAARVVVNVPEDDATPAVPSDRSCFSKLKGMNVDFLPQATGSGSCRVDQAVLLRAVSVGGREVKLPDRPIVTCPFALEFAEWVKATGVPLAKLYTGPGYQCRGRNGSSSGKLSEHARGNAVDIERMQMADGATLWVRDANGNRKLKAMRALACSHFTTVLGPGSNAAHASHFHFDLAERRGGYRICQ